MKKLYLVFLAGFLSLLIFSPVLATRFDHGMPGIYNATLFTLGDGEGSGLSTDINGRILLSPSSTISATISTTSTINVSTITNPASTTLTYLFDNSSATVNIKASAGRFHGMVMDNASGGKLFIQIHNTAGLPTLGAVPLISIPINQGNQMIMDASYFQYLQKYFSSGIGLSISSTFGTSTPSASYTSVNLMVDYD